jgi:hypothetical protein
MIKSVFAKSEQLSFRASANTKSVPFEVRSSTGILTQAYPYVSLENGTLVVEYCVVSAGSHAFHRTLPEVLLQGQPFFSWLSFKDHSDDAVFMEVVETVPEPAQLHETLEVGAEN